MVRIYKGDDTDFADLNEIVITIKTDLDISGYSGKFVFQGVDRNFSAGQLADKQVNVAYTSAETRVFSLGQNYGVFHLYDTEGRHAAAQKVVIDVISHSSSACTCSCECGCENEVEIVIDNVYDYNKLGNIPTLNGVQIKGTLTSADLGLDCVVDGYLHDGAFYLTKTESGTYEDVVTPAANHVYIDKEEDCTYRWNGSEYIQIGGGGGGTAQVQSDWTETNTSKKSFIKNKPDVSGVPYATPGTTDINGLIVLYNQLLKILKGDSGYDFSSLPELQEINTLSDLRNAINKIITIAYNMGGMPATMAETTTETLLRQTFNTMKSAIKGWDVSSVADMTESETIANYRTKYNSVASILKNED